LGLGLSKAWRIVTDHGGTLSVASPATGGAAFTIELPGA
jgi:C4-dicarboxylate-specific signal transduction histidine kinase